MTHPDWALKHKTKGTELRFIRGKYYLYNVSSCWNKEKGRAQKITGKLIGTISEEGLTLRGTKKQLSISNKEYGASFIVQQVSDDVIESLKTFFPKYWQELLVLAINRLLYRSPLKNMEFIYQESFLSEQFTIDLSKNRLTSLFKEISKEQISAFLRKFVDGSEHLIFDTTHVISQSNSVGINQYGYNSKHEFSPQINLFYMFSVDKQLPVYYRVLPGNISGIKALKLCITESEAKNTIMIGDKGFCSEQNIKLLEDFKYILPLRRNSSLVNYDRLKSRDYEKAFEGHFFYNNRAIFYYELSKPRIVVFYDSGLRTDEETSYLSRIDKKLEGYTQENYQERQFAFGTISLITNIDCSAKEIYENYKTRMEVETVFDTYKNLLQADRTYMHSCEGINAWVFINHLSTLMYYKILNLIKKHDLLKQLSPKDLLLILSRIEKLKIKEKWYLSEINNKTKKILDKLGLQII